MNALDIMLWGVLPYLVALVLIAGTIWRYKYDQFGWTTRNFRSCTNHGCASRPRCFTTACSWC